MNDNGENVMSTYTYDCKGRKYITEINWSETIGDAEHITFINAENVESIGSYFLRDCTRLTSVDLSGFRNVISIGDGCLACCKGLTSIDLSALVNVEKIWNWFLYNCTGLTSIDLSGLEKVTTIGSWFLYGCTGLGDESDWEALKQQVLNNKQREIKQ